MNFSNQKTVEFIFQKPKGDNEQRIYLFDTIQDQKV